MALMLNNGIKMPIIGLGVWRMQGQEVRDLIINSIKLGYRHFDCADFLFGRLYVMGDCEACIVTSPFRDNTKSNSGFVTYSIVYNTRT
ncbi:hypothetical protein K1719_005325 [Acacia pycnantha]|nr:hypothetical protein K1719_005325 [Acacia pycnantha]